MELWRQCASWLIECRVLPDNHRVTWEGAQVKQLYHTKHHICTCHHGWLPPFHFLHVFVFCQVCDLAQALRDGVLLCQLLNNLLPQAVNLREINLRPQMSQVTHTNFDLLNFHSDPDAALKPFGWLIGKYCDLNQYLYAPGECSCMMIMKNKTVTELLKCMFNKKAHLMGFYRCVACKKSTCLKRFCASGYRYLNILHPTTLLFTLGTRFKWPHNAAKSSLYIAGFTWFWTHSRITCFIN